MDGSVSSTRVTVEEGAPLDPLATVTVTESEVNWKPFTSRATAVRVWNPSLVAVVAQGASNEGPKTSGPRVKPSSLNWTLPSELRLAQTVTVPATLESEAGDVMVTTGPSWAKA